MCINIIYIIYIIDYTLYILCYCADILSFEHYLFFEPTFFFYINAFRGEVNLQLPKML